MTKEEIKARARMLYGNNLTDKEIETFFKSKGGYPNILELENFMAKTENLPYQALLELSKKEIVIATGEGDANA